MTMPQRRAMRVNSLAERSVTVIARFPIYRQIGRRPSQVYVDETMRPAASGAPARRLSDNVFWRTYAEIGDQIEEHAAGLLLLTDPTVSHRIQLSAPRPLEVATAFAHADTILREDRKILDGLLASGTVGEALSQRSRSIASRVPDTSLAEDHPLVVTVRPLDLDAEPPAPANPGEAASVSG